jgi:hypothetical protein
MSMKTIKQALEHGPLCMVELAGILKQHRSTITHPLRKLRDRKEVHVAYYERQPEGQGGAFIPFYKLGGQHDARRPAPITKQERDKTYRRRHSAIISAKRYPHHVAAMGVWSGLGARE